MNIEDELEVTAFSIGPFTFDMAAGQVTLACGVYTIRSPVTFTFDGANVFGVSGGMEYRPLAEDGAEPN